MMMVAAAARRHLSLMGVNLWQTGIRSLFNFFIYRSELSQDDAWSAVRAEMEPRCPNAEEWEFQQIRAVLYEEENMTLEAAIEMYGRYPDSTPLLDSIRACLQNLDRYRVDESE